MYKQIGMIRYEQMILKNDNIEMGSWSVSFRAHALALLASGKRREALTVLQRLVATSPYDLESHLTLMENIGRVAEARASAEVIIRNAETPDLYAKAAEYLGRPITTIETIPYIEKKNIKQK